ncbi:hypothetical protein [Acinetobacter radioresistens]|uniref:hypothetical protein n=1 Tax=Acinetobacter radioresistens TaxID=40216 RepID=UPI000EECA50E|nr:hypothetical protein [Acinetobacter radioresistens]MCK4106258.1 hypothetical protein [Acinetobacter radioresistens]MCX0343096.1 hypothetical protein [Acinetobacter radioresistens]HAD68272.1 hypothetical protein [Acinetobacter radioresistens]
MQELSNLECVKSAVGRLLIDFKKWTKPDTKPFRHWKRLEARHAIQVVAGRMIDDADAMLAKYRQQAPEKDFTGPLPIMLVALAPMVSPPDISSLRNTPYWLDTVIPTDPKNTPIKLRTIARQYRVQLLMVSADADTTQSVINQFVAYMGDDYKRRFKVTYDLGNGVKDDWEMTVLENSLYPDSVPSGQNNLSLVTVDFQFVGLLPQVVGLGDEDEEDVDMDGRDPVEIPGEYNPDTGEEIKPPIQQEWSVIVEADLHHKDRTESEIFRAIADPETGERHIERVPNHE